MKLRLMQMLIWMEKLLKAVLNIAKCNCYNLYIDIISDENIKNKTTLLNAAVARCIIAASLKPGIIKKID